MANAKQDTLDNQDLKNWSFTPLAEVDTGEMMLKFLFDNKNIQCAKTIVQLYDEVAANTPKIIFFMAKNIQSIFTLFIRINSVLRQNNTCQFRV